MTEAFRFDPATSTWSLTSGSAPEMGLHDSAFVLEVDGRRLAPSSAAVEPPEEVSDALGQHTRRTVLLGFADSALEWRLAFDVAPGAARVLMSGEITNRSGTAVTLGDCCLVSIGPGQGRLDLGPEPDRQTVFHCTCTPQTQHVKRIRSDDGRHDNAPVCHIHNPASGKTYHAAFVTVDRAHGSHTIRYDVDTGTVRHEARCGFAGFALSPGACIRTETLMVEIADSPYTTLETWASLVNAVYAPPIPAEALVGWVGWAWVDGFTTEAAESLVARNAAAVKRRLAGFGVDYLWVSIANLEGGLPGNWLTFSRDCFPSGFESTVARLRELGIKPGLWMAPFWLCQGSRGLEENCGNLLRTPSGEPRKARTWPWAYKAAEGEEPHLFCLDGSHPDTVAYLQRVMTAYRQMGICYFMIDFLHGGMPLADDLYHDPRMVRGPEVYRNALLALREAAGADIHLLPATGACFANIGIVNSSRIGADYGEGRHLLPRFRSYPATYEINGAEKSTSTPHRNALQNVGASYFTHRRFWLANANMLTVDKPISRNEAEMSATLFGMSGSPIMLGDDIDTMHDERLAMIKKVLPRPRTTAFPVDLFERVYPEDYSRMLWVRVATDWADWGVLAVFNLDDEPFAASISLDRLGLDSSQEQRVFDFWQERYLGTCRGTLSVHVPPFSCRVLRLAAVRPHPWVLSTDMHLRQGELELRAVAWDPRTLSLSGTAERPRGEVGTLYLVAPSGYKPADYRGLWVAKDARDGALVMRKNLVFDESAVAWNVAFEALPEIAGQ